MFTISVYYYVWPTLPYSIAYSLKMLSLASEPHYSIEEDVWTSTGVCHKLHACDVMAHVEKTWSCIMTLVMSISKTLTVPPDDRDFILKYIYFINFLQ